MREYHNFGALPYTFPSDGHEVVGHLIKCMVRIRPATTPRALGKLGWQLPMCPFAFSIKVQVVCCALDSSSFEKYKLHHQGSLNRITIALSLMHQGYYIEAIRIPKLSLLLTMYYMVTLAKTMSHLCH